MKLKKISAIILTLVMLLGVTACTAPASEPANASTAPIVTTQAVETTAAEIESDKLNWAEPHVYNLSEDEEVKNIILLIGVGMGENIIKSCLHTILMLIARMYVKYESDTISAHEKKKLSINHCISYIDIHYDENISLKQIAKMSAMSTTTFCNLFKKTTGMSFREYLNKKKIERAQSYLRAGEGVNETAYLCGFKEISTFYRNFVKYTGVPPSDYKNKNL